MENYITVLGGANIDIIGTPFKKPKLHDSNPGSTLISLGGVGRNIAENLSKLNIQVELITILGDDAYAAEIKNSCKDLGIGLSHSLIVENQPTSSYLCINDELGEMQLAISDMEIYKYITPKYLSEKLGVINGGKACVLDTNISIESFKFVMDYVEVPIFLDTVSIEKTRNIKDLIYGVHTLKPNILEAEILSNMKIENRDDLEEATDIIMKKGVKNVFVSLGSEGVYYTNGVDKGSIPIIKSETVSTTGAGDSFLAAVVWSFLQGYHIRKSAKAGIAAASITVKSKSTVSNKMSAVNIKNILDKMEVENE
ncbi:MAG: carbohydrate kinase family protein [Tissierellaceae bacterium]|nr:carbohydrate kinase family protein [Tissierellaceae bacterium]